MYEVGRGTRRLMKGIVMGTGLDDLLNDSAPATVVSERGRAAMRSLSREIVGSDDRQGPRRATVIAGGVLAAVLLGGATAAAASPDVRLALGWVPDRTIARSIMPLDGGDARACTAYFHITTEGTPSAAGVERARTFIAGIDPDSIQADPELVMTNRQLYRAQDPDGTTAQINAYGAALANTMWADLKAHGFTEDSYLISFEQNSDCDDQATP